MAMYDSPYHDYPPRPAPRQSLWPFLLILLFLVLPAGYLAWRFWPHAAGLNDPDAQPRAITPPGERGADEKATIEMFRQASPSVVHVSNLDDSGTAQGTGSGFVWDKEGRVVTNFHVINGGSGFHVTLADHSNWKAVVVGAAPDKDLAVLYIAAPKDRLHPISVGTSHDLQVGQNAFAIGNPFGLDQSLTKGIISALGREIESMTRRPIKNVIQTDAAVNPGNSGGPLLDSAARLIGVNTAIYSPSGANAGIGFAIPVDEVNEVVPQLIRHGKIIRPGLGVVPAPDLWARRFGVQDGVLIWKVAPDSAAAKAGLRPTRRDEDTGEVEAGDVLTAINGASLHTGKDMYSAFDKYKVGDTVTVTILRDGKQQDVKVTLQPVG